nr:unnamed protein product [Haemonchus contortus]
MSAIMPGRRRRRIGEEDDRTLIDGATKLICRQKSWSPSRLLSKKQSPNLSKCDPIGDQGEAVNRTIGSPRTKVGSSSSGKGSWFWAIVWRRESLPRQRFGLRKI